MSYIVIGSDHLTIRHQDTGKTTHVRLRDVTKDAVDHDIDGLQRGADDLCVIHLPFSGDVSILELVEKRTAYAFDLPTRLVTAEYRDGFQQFGGEEGQAIDAAVQVLKPVRIVRGHALISRPVWLYWRADHAATVARREALLAKPQSEAAA